MIGQAGSGRNKPPEDVTGVVDLWCSSALAKGPIQAIYLYFSPRWRYLGWPSIPLTWRQLDKSDWPINVGFIWRSIAPIDLNKNSGPDARRLSV